MKNCFKKSEFAEYFVAYKDDKAVMIAPIHIKKHGVEYRGFGTAAGVYIIGQWGFTDYLNFIYDKFDGECADAIIAEIKKKYPRLHLRFMFIKEGNNFQKYLSEKYEDFCTGKSVCVHILPHESFEDYYKNLTKHARQNIRTSLNREKKNKVDICIKEHHTVSKKEAEDFFQFI